MELILIEIGVLQGKRVKVLRLMMLQVNKKNPVVNALCFDEQQKLKNV